MKLKLNKKHLKNLSKATVLDAEQAKQVGGGGPVYDRPGYSWLYTCDLGCHIASAGPLCETNDYRCSE